ncbi:hypothetical protein ALO59_200003 [Pseudomonas amygdali pv. mellea]|nr:hypothetical protein ALO59_200003 [Pseudomonas amygdali pv. mellea]
MSGWTFQSRRGSLVRSRNIYNTFVTVAVVYYIISIKAYSGLSRSFILIYNFHVCGRRDILRSFEVR